MAFLDWIAFIFGILGVVLTIRQSTFCWPISLVGVIASLIAFFQQRLYGDAALQIVFLIYGFYGWHQWFKAEKSSFIISTIPTKFLLLLLLFSIILFFGIYYVLIAFKGDKVLLDAVLTTLSLATTFMMIKKWIENWLFWVAIDLAYVGLYVSKQMYLFAVLYLIFSTVALAGFFEWKKVLRK
jgi:nicotinamide mononucleotide transporter